MPMEIPEPLAGYVAAQNARNIEAMLAPFADAAIVRDESREYRGTSAIRGWMEATTAKYNPTVEVLDACAAGEKVVLSVSVSGTFPGSPIRLRYDFTLEQDRIARLVIET